MEELNKKKYKLEKPLAYYVNKEKFSFEKLIQKNHVSTRSSRVESSEGFLTPLLSPQNTFLKGCNCKDYDSCQAFLNDICSGDDNGGKI